MPQEICDIVGQHLLVVSTCLLVDNAPCMASTCAICIRREGIANIVEPSSADNASASL